MCRASEHPSAPHEPSTAPGSGPRPRPNLEDLIILRDLLESRKMNLVIDREFPLESLPDAIRHMESWAVKGKILIRMADANSGAAVDAVAPAVALRSVAGQEGR